MADFKYDVAFSLLDQDEPTARDVVKLLPESVSSFLYTERQEVLISRDGTEAFSALFARESRLVCVLYRRGWGETRATQLEAEAIKTRRWNEGADFLTFVRLDDEPVPAWIPPNRIWGQLDTLGTNGLAAVLLVRAQERGSVAQEETAIELAQRVDREQAEEAKRLAFLGSEEGVRAADSSALAVLEEAATLGPGIGAEVTRERAQVLLWRPPFSVGIGWRYNYRNSLDGSILWVSEWRGRPDVGGRFFGENKTQLTKHSFDFDQPAPGDSAWRSRETGRLFSPQQLADWAATLLLHRVRRKSEGGRNG